MWPPARAPLGLAPSPSFCRMAVDEPLAVPRRRPKQGSQTAWPQGRATTGSLVSCRPQLALANLMPQTFSWVLPQAIMLFFACHVGCRQMGQARGAAIFPARAPQGDV